MNCKLSLREINISGTAVSAEALAHIKGCKSCAGVYNLERSIEGFILENSKADVPDGFKTAIVKSIESRKKKKAVLPLLSYAFKFTAIAAILIFGLWLGIQTANGSRENNNPTETDVYALNTSPAYPDNLGDIYFAVLEEAQNEK
jgi:hypothetical protein